MEFDYVIIGAGASGCVLAERLSARRDARVLVVEAGAPDSHPSIPVPGRWTTLLGSELDWGYLTEPDPALGGRQVSWPVGRTYGGSTAINAMAHVRGHQLCFDGWAQDLGRAWSFASLLPYFRRLEDNSRGASDYHGAGGPLAVSDTTDPHAGHLAFLEAARLRGFDADPQFDFNGARHEHGAGFYQKTIRSGRRVSAADAFLRPALARPNLTAWPNTRVRRVLFTGTRATGIECERAGRVVQVRAVRAVVLTAGVIESPKLLMLSGVGPALELRRHGIGVVADRPGVGANLHDHPRVSVRWAGRTVLPASSVSAGLLAFSGRAAGTRPPDLQFYVGRGIDTPDDSITLTVAVSQVRSRGSVALRSADPSAPPLIRPNYFADPSDLDAMVDAVELARALGGSRAFDTLRGDPIAPDGSVRSAAEIRAFIRSTSATMFHPVGTCRMGSDADSIVDPQLRVRGVERLWVADASVIPTVVNTQIQAVVMVIGYRAAEEI
jgi:choline dehydrogenase